MANRELGYLVNQKYTPNRHNTGWDVALETLPHNPRSIH